MVKKIVYIPGMPDYVPRYLMIEEASERRQVTTQTIYSWIRRGIVVCEWFGGFRHIDRVASEENLRQRPANNRGGKSRGPLADC